MINGLNAIESELRDGQVGPEGKIRISCPVLFGRRCVAPVLRSLTRLYPKIQVETEFSDRVIDILSEGFDMAIRIGSVADSTSLIAKKIAVQRMAIFAAPQYLEKFGTPTSIAELKDHQAILYGRSIHTQPWVVRDHQGTLKEVVLPGRERYDDLQVIADSAIEGGGLAWLPSWLGAPYLVSGQLSLVMDSDKVQPIDIHVVWPKTKYLPHRMRLLIDALATQIPVLMG